MSIKPKLIRNIKETLAKPLDVSGMTALLADTRKLIEASGRAAEDKYATLKFHCDWVLHTKMDRKFAAELLQDFDRTWEECYIQQHQLPKEFMETLPRRVGLYGFECELIELLAEYGIPMPASNRLTWLPFHMKYCEIVQDTTLSYSLKDQKKKPLKHIDGARFCMFRIDDTPEHIIGDELPFGLRWEFTRAHDVIFGLDITFPRDQREPVMFASKIGTRAIP